MRTQKDYTCIIMAGWDFRWRDNCNPSRRQPSALCHCDVRHANVLLLCGMHLQDWYGYRLCWLLDPSDNNLTQERKCKHILKHRHRSRKLNASNSFSTNAKILFFFHIIENPFGFIYVQPEGLAQSTLYCDSYGNNIMYNGIYPVILSHAMEYIKEAACN